jgi:hypothetical protein
MKLLLTLSSIVVLTGLGLSPIHADDSWQAKLRQELPLLGHRNWIVVVDSAYPLQTSPGVETIETNSDAPTVLEAVLKAVSSAPHVRPILYTDAELPFVAEADAPGITAYRAALKKALGGKTTESLPHEQIIAKLDEAGKTFHVLILKTHLTLPYTSLFLQLQCGYWSADAEARLRAAMTAAGADAAPAK